MEKKELENYRKRTNEIKHNIETVSEFLKKLDHNISVHKLEIVELNVGIYPIDVITTATGAKLIDLLKKFMIKYDYDQFFNEEYIKK